MCAMPSNGFCNHAHPCTPVTGWIGFALNFCSTLCKVQFQGYPSKMFCNKLHVASLPYHHNRMDWLPMVLCTISAAPYCKMSARYSFKWFEPTELWCIPIQIAVSVFPVIVVEWVWKILNLRRVCLSYTMHQILSEGGQQLWMCTGRGSDLS